MEVDLKRLVRRNGALVSAVAAIAVIVVILVQRIGGGAINLVQFDFFAVTTSLEFAARAVGGGVGGAVVVAVAFGIGYFISLWLVAPIAAELRMGHVISRAILATGIGATVLFIALTVNVYLLASFEWPPTSFSVSEVGFVLGVALQTALRLLLELLPLGVLAGVLLWHWRKDHPPKHPLSGYIDEV